MTSWRSTTDAALEAAARDGKERWPRYAEFALLQAKGLRKQAFATLTPFVEELAVAPWDARWAFATWLYGTAVGPQIVFSALAPHPLQQRVLIPTLEETQMRDPATPEAYLWLVEHHRLKVRAPGVPENQDPVPSFLRGAIARYPHEPRLRRALAATILGTVEFSAHHLSQSVYLGDLTEDLARLQEACGVLDPRDPANTPLLDELARAESQIHTWQRWCAEGRPGKFPSWCQEQRLTAPAQTIHVYYRPKT